MFLLILAYGSIYGHPRMNLQQIILSTKKIRDVKIHSMHAGKIDTGSGDERGVSSCAVPVDLRVYRTHREAAFPGYGGRIKLSPLSVTSLYDVILLLALFSIRLG